MEVCSERGACVSIFARIVRGNHFLTKLFLGLDELRGRVGNREPAGKQQKKSFRMILSALAVWCVFSNESALKRTVEGSNMRWVAFVRGRP